MIFCEWSIINYDIIDYGVKRDFHKKSFIESDESYPYWLKLHYGKR